MPTNPSPHDQQSEFLLEDGSTLFLNWGTELTVSMTSESRSVSLLTGEAIFSVASDHARPFIVSVDDVQVHAVGTQFNVRKVADGHVNVAVTEGVVEVSLDPASVAQQSPVRLEAGQSLGVSGQSFEDVANASVAAISSWRDGMLVFENRPLIEVLAELDRYTPHIILAANLDALDLDVSGTFFIADIDDALLALAQMFNLSITTTDDSDVKTVTVSPSSSV